jgi:hypothetical protein
MGGGAGGRQPVRSTRNPQCSVADTTIAASGVRVLAAGDQKTAYLQNRIAIVEVSRRCAFSQMKTLQKGLQICRPIESGVFRSLISSKARRRRGNRRTGCAPTPGEKT